MALPNIFSAEVTQNMVQRINHLTPETQAKWGKMNVAQMLAHCNVTYELEYENKHKKPGAMARFFLKAFVKKMVVNEKPYKKSLRTAPYFIIADQKQFENEKDRLIQYIKKTQELGEAYYDNRKSDAFGVMTKTEWNNLFYKHLDHHLSQFGV